MKIHISRFLIVFVAIIPLAFSSETEPADGSPPQEKKDYHFFVGADLRIPYEETFFSVERIWNAQAHIKVNDEIVAQKVSGIKDIKVDRRAKISPHFAQIMDLNCEPVYSVGRDPRTLAARQQVIAESMAAGLTDQVDSAYRQSANPDAFKAPPSLGLNTQVAGDFETQLAADQESALSFSNVMEHGDIEALSDMSVRDMLHIQFSISSDQYFPSGHLVFIFQLTDRPEGEPVMSWFHFLSLNELSPEGKSYDYRLAAYPDGMYIASQEVFLFANGDEIATNLSSKHVPMRGKDARVFLKYQYLAENSGKTRPPDRSWKYLDSPLRDKVNPDIREQIITLKIGPDGQVLDVLTSREVQIALTPLGIHEIASLIYLPALENGKPVAGELNLALKDVILE